jgi:hypothetical protein
MSKCKTGWTDEFGRAKMGNDHVVIFMLHIDRVWYGKFSIGATFASGLFFCSAASLGANRGEAPLAE